MNPALQNYLQNQQQQAAPQQSQPYNPFDSGIQKAIASARQSLGMSKDQEEDAFNKGLLAFGDAIAASPREKGFLNNLTSAGRALSPGIRAYDEAENTSLGQNQALANEILKQDALEKQRQVEAEDRAWSRQHAERQLGEQRRYHDLMYGGMGRGTLGGMNEATGQFTPINNKVTQNNYINDKKKYGMVLKQVDTALKDNSQIEKNYENDLVSPTGPFSKLSAPVQNLWGILVNNKELKEKTAKRQALNSEFVELKAGLERALKGGVLGPKILEYFDKESVYPTINDTVEKREEQLNKIRQKIAEAYESADLSLKYGVQIDPYNLDQFKNYLKQQQTALTQEAPAQEKEQAASSAQPTPDHTWVDFVDPEDPENKIRVLPRDAEKAERAGWRRSA